ncbi:MAG: cyclic nucleotide-binding domain-containing protein [Sphingomonadales bacterium]
MAASVIALSKFIHEAQKERGLSMLCVVSPTAANLAKYAIQNGETDATWAKIKSITHERHKPTIDRIEAALQTIGDCRHQVLNEEPDIEKVMVLYSGPLMSTAFELMAALTSHVQATDNTKANALLNLHQWKERVGQGRATGVLVAAQEGGALDGSQGARLRQLIAEMRSFESIFFALSDKMLGTSYTQDTKANGALTKLAEIDDAISGNTSAQPLKGLRPEDWFGLLTEKMEVLQKLVLHIAGSLHIEKPTNIEDHAQALTKETLLRLGEFKQLPLFTDMSDEQLTAFLAEGRLMHFKRGQMLFLQGEPAKRFFIILDGWVKVLKHNVDGEEAVMEVLTSGDLLSETVVMKDAPYPFTAQAAENAELYAFPADFIQQQVRDNSLFAINMLNLAAGRSQSLINQFEQLTLKNVTQRVGRFLLKQFIESGKSRTELKLPFEKSVIASYLGMKPETFSRTLASLRSQGIQIDRDKVTLPDALALCTYCDMEIAGKCPRHGTEACPNPDCALH